MARFTRQEPPFRWGTIANDSKMCSKCSELLDTLRGRELSAITFVRDYLQLQFDGPYLNVFVWPTILTGDRVLRRDSTSYRDTLCRQIGIAVAAAIEVPNEKLALAFVDGTSFEISLREKDLVRGEAVLFRDDLTKQWNVW